LKGARNLAAMAEEAVTLATAAAALLEPSGSG
jgi:hypothetical protein